MSAPSHSMWGPSRQLGGGLNHLQVSSSSSIDSTYLAAYNHLINVTH
jgi:hypothetical protein